MEVTFHVFQLFVFALLCVFVRPMPNGDSRRDPFRDPSQETESSEPSSAPEPKGLTAKAKAVTPGSPASTSSYELVTEEEEVVEVPERRKPKTPTTPDVESSEDDRRRDEKETYHGRGRSPVKSASDPKGPRSANPKASSAGKPAEEHVKCRFCWRRIRACASARAQHEFWNLNCLRWQFRAEGHNWGEACRLASACKARREEEEDSPPRLVAPAKVKNPAPVLKEAKHKRKVHKEKSKKEKKAPEAPKKKKKDKAKAKRKRREATSSPTPVRKKARKPPSSESSDSRDRPPKEGRAKRNAPRTLVIRLPR